MFTDVNILCLDCPFVEVHSCELSPPSHQHGQGEGKGSEMRGSEIRRVASGARRVEDLITKVAQKITLSPSRESPVDKLELRQSNVRRIKAGASVEELAEDIARRWLLQNLNVRPVIDADDAETRKFEITARSRRFQALLLSRRRSDGQPDGSRRICCIRPIADGRPQQMPQCGAPQTCRSAGAAAKSSASW